MSRRARNFALFLLLAPVLIAEARQGAEPLSRTYRAYLSPAAAVATIETPALDAASRRALALEEPSPVQFAEPAETDVSPEKSGTWDVLPDGSQIWRCRISCPGATDINFGFARFNLPDAATLHMYSEQHDYYQGPYTASDHTPDGELWTPVVPGDAAVIELYIPAAATGQAELWLTRVNRGFLDLFGLEPHPLAGQQSCNIDVICPEGDFWRSEIRSVARYTILGSLLCTGTLVMDAPSSFRPYFLTANHCGVNGANQNSVVVYWNVESPACGQLSGGSLSQNQSGATLRAARSDVDVALLELAARPEPAFDVHYAGWDARPNTVTWGSVAIHHPDGQEKALAINSNLLLAGNNCAGAGADTHWYMNWEAGTTESGSSGSAAWDTNTHRVVGFLTGGSASCASMGAFDCFGRFSVAWTNGASAAQQLKEWLDPANSGILTLDGRDPPSLGLSKTAYEGHDLGASCPGEATLFTTSGAPVTFCISITNLALGTVSNILLLDPLYGLSNLVGSLNAGTTFTLQVEAFVPGDTVNTAGVFGVSTSGAAFEVAASASIFTTLPSGRIWLNEFNYDDVNADIAEFIEVAGQARAPLNDHALVLYRGDIRTAYRTNRLGGTLLDEGCGYGALHRSFTNAIQNGQGGIALVAPTGVVEFLSYGGSFTALGGEASGLAAKDTGVSEGSATPDGFSVRRTGAGNGASDFLWMGPTNPSPGTLNALQLIIPCGPNDFDGDGLPDEWEFDHGLDPLDDGTAGESSPGAKDGPGGASGHADSDGVSNMEEYLADTWPTNGLHYLKVDTLSANSPMEIRWATSTGRTYNVQFHPGAPAAAGWTNLQSNIPGTGGTNTLVDAADATQRTYRIEAVLPP